MCVSVGDEVLVEFCQTSKLFLRCTHHAVSQLNPLTLGKLKLHVYVVNVRFGKSFVNQFNQ